MFDYHINIFEGKQPSITKSIHRKGVEYMKHDYKNAWKKRYILEVGDKVVDIFGNVVTISEILHHESTKTSNFLVEENGNCYCPNEIAGIFIKYLSESELNSLINK